MMNRFVAFSDSHVAEWIWAGHPALRGDSLESIRFVLEMCRREACPAVHAGDMFHSNRPSPDLFSSLHRLFADIPTKCYSVEGNHDGRAKAALAGVEPWTKWPAPAAGEAQKHLSMPWVGFMPGVVLLDESADSCVDLAGGGKMRGFGYRGEDALMRNIASIPEDTRILVLHQMGKQFIKYPSPSAFDLDQIPGFVELVVIGDVHVTEEYTTPSGTKVISPGSTRLVSMSEDYKKFAYDVRITGEGIFFDRIRIPSRVIMSAAVLDDASLNMAKITMENMRSISDEMSIGLQPVLVVEVASSVKDAGIIIRETAERFGVYPIITTGTMELSLGAMETGGDEPDADILARFIDRNEPAFGVSCALLRGDPVRESLRGMRAAMAPKIENSMLGVVTT